MPELPDITVYIEALENRILGQAISKIRINNPFVLRTANPPIQSIVDRRIVELRRMGKRIVFGFEGDYWLILHLMIAGRLHWQEAGSAKPSGAALAHLEFQNGTLSLTEAGSKRRASLFLVQGEGALVAYNPGGMEVIGCSLQDFTTRVRSQNHTLKRALTDPHLFSGIGNAYSDEIFHHACLSPVALSQKLSDEEVQRLHHSTEVVLTEWTERLRNEAGTEFPEGVTAFRSEMAVHGKFNKPCPVCGTKVQRIRYADNETNYCPTCQTGGKLLADRSLSLLLKRDWPKTVDELERIRFRLPG